MRSILDHEYFGALEKLSVLARGRRARGGPGTRTSSSRGCSLEFSDYRRYAPGDDLRHVDWNVYARLEKLFVRQFRGEANLDIYVVLDISRSMDFGTANKLDFACRLALALTYVGVSGMDRVGLATISDRLHDLIPPRRGEHQLALILELLERVEAADASNLGRACRDLITEPIRGGIAILLSDFFDASGYEEGLTLLQVAGLDLFLVQILDEEELDPGVQAGETLVDLERSFLPAVTVDDSATSRYRSALAQFNSGLESFSRRTEAGFLRLCTSTRLEEVIVQLLTTGLLA